MPEGPEVETIRRSLHPLLVGRTVGAAWVSKKALRTRVPAKAFAPLAGRAITGTGRKGKLMWIDVDNGAGLFVRLGMSGKLTVGAPDADVAPHTHVRLPLAATAGPLRELRYVDPRRFGEIVPFADATTKERELARMGPDAFALAGADKDDVVTRLRATERSLKDVLLDQSVLAGVGNIYAAEALYLARLSPFRTGKSLRGPDVARLLDAVAQVLKEAVGRRGTSFSNYVDGLGVPGENLGHLFVFQREGEPCRTCGRLVERATQGARSTFFCRTCQRVAKLRRRLR
jgi:formamidopyrimidine-DNA glycosylase